MVASSAFGSPPERSRLRRQLAVALGAYRARPASDASCCAVP